MSKSIQTLWGGAFAKIPDSEVINFLSGRDVNSLPPADWVLLPYDLKASKAHAKMLFKVNLITKSELEKLLEGLGEIEKLYQEGKFVLDPAKEDMHTNIEAYLIAKYGLEVGGKIHTARSRNDQIVTAVRLYLRETVQQFIKSIQVLDSELKNLAKKHNKTIMPGYTHQQKAMPTTFSEILLAFSAMLERDLEKFASWLSIWNKNPLGAMAGFGTSFKIDRKYTAELLGFTGVEKSTIDTVTSRWEAESDFVYAVCSLMEHLSILAQTFILFSGEHFGYITIADQYCTGSSIMPQKKNPDVLEVVKGKTGWVQGQLMSLLAIGSKNLLGYNRDTQWTKYIIIDIVRECLPVPKILAGLIKTLKVNSEAMKKATKTGNLFATNYVEKLVQDKGLSLREAKIKVEKMIKEGKYRE